MLELNLFGLVTNPSYSVQRRAVMSDDGLGWTWQCNVFGHYILVCTSEILLTQELTINLFLFLFLSPSLSRAVSKCRALEAKLAASRTGPGRVVWMSSYAADPTAYDADDWQLVNSQCPYEASKFQMDLIRAELSRRAGPSAQVRHFTVDPGAVDTSISAALDSGILTYLKVVLLYLVRSNSSRISFLFL
jgi:3-keto steroid reductase